jgi:uncharacterized protein YjdB
MNHRLALLVAVVAAACSTGPSADNVARVVITGDDATLIVGDTKTYAARAEDAAGGVVGTAPIVWRSNASSVASVSTAGLVTAVAPGTARIIATSGAHADTVNVTVATSAVANVVVTINRALLKVSDTVQATAIAVNAAGLPVLDRPVTWTTSNPSAALVTPFGLVLGIAPANPVTVTATVDGKSGSATIAIIEADIAEVIVLPDSALMRPGGTVQLQVQVIDEFGFEVLDPEITWSSFVENVATVSNTGLVTAVAIGESTIRATVRGSFGTSLARVLDVNTERYTISVTNFLANPIEVLENGNSVGIIPANSSGTIDRPLRASFQFGWAVVRPQGRGEEVGETAAAIPDPIGTYHFEVDNVLQDGRVFYTPFIRNLSPNKGFMDPLPKVGATPCQCPLAPEDQLTRNLGYWLLNPTSVMRFFLQSDPGLTTPVKTVQVPAAEVEARSGIYRYTLVSLP